MFELTEFIITAFIHMNISSSVSAYIDPNTGGLLFQVLAGLFAFFSGFVLIFSRQLKTAWARIRRYFRERTGGKDEDTNIGI